MSAGAVFLIVASVTGLLVVNAFAPVRREPLSVLSFFLGWPTGELAIQNLVVEVVLVVAFCLLGALSTWEGRVGLAVALATAAGLVRLAVAGRRSAAVVARALAEATGPALPLAGERVEPAWGRWWRVTRAIPLRGRSTEMIRDVDYWGDGIRRHRLDVYRSKAASTPGSPVMVYIHGGAWVMGDKREQGKPMMFELVARGWVCVSINYRLSPKATWPDHVVDCKRALAWVRRHIAEYGGDPGFVAVSGGSAGGHLCALLGLSANDPAFQPGFETADTTVDACVPFYGVMDMTGQGAGRRYDKGLLELLEKRVMKTTYAAEPEVFVQASPTHRVHGGAPPFFVLHGGNDTLVPVESAREFVSRLRAESGAPVAYAELPLAQHAFDVLASLRCQATTAGVASFLDAVRAARSAVPGRPGPGPTPPGGART